MPTLVHLTDLHLDHWPGNLDAAVDLIGQIPADLYLIGGDNGGDEGLRRTVCLLQGLCPRAAIGWIRGNHDLWHRPYTHLWDDCAGLEATALERHNLETEHCIVVGSYGHYDYSGGTPALSLAQYETYADIDGRTVWNDRFIDRLGRTNPQIAREVADRFRERYEAAVQRGLPIVVLTHTWPFAPTDDRLRSFTSAYCCNQLIGDILTSAAARPAVLFCGHTHMPARWDEFGFPMINTGSDYTQVRVTRWELPGSAGGGMAISGPRRGRGRWWWPWG